MSDQRGVGPTRWIHKIVTTMLTSKETSKNVGHNTNLSIILYLLVTSISSANVFHRSKCVHSPLVGSALPFDFVLDMYKIFNIMLSQLV